MSNHGTEVALRATPTAGELDEIKEQVRLIANTEFVPKAYRNNPHAILACVLTGRGLGLDPMHSLRSIYVVDGKPTLSAELMVALARESGHSITGNYAPDTVTVKGKRGDNGDEMEVTWTMDMAKRAGLVTRANWKNYPESMLWARAVSQLCRMLFPDVVKHVSYVADEAERTVEEKVEGMVSDLPLPKDETVEEVPPDAIEMAEAEIAEQEPVEEKQPTIFEAPPAARKKTKAEANA